MSLKCNNCNFEGLRDEFPAIYRASDPGPDLYRKCPMCDQLIYSDELEQDETSPNLKIWGISPLRGKVFRRTPKIENDI